MALFFITREFLVALRCDKCGVQVPGLKCLFRLLCGAGSAVAQCLLVTADCRYLDLSRLQSQELVACVSLPCSSLEWFMNIQSFGRLKLDESQLLNRLMFCPSKFP